jgi:Flp pilus assembly protein TadG
MSRFGDERGALSTFVAVIALALLMASGLAVDGGRKVAALGEASHLADNAARAGAQAVDLDTLRSTGELRLRPDEATSRATDYLASLGHEGQIQVVGDTVSVTVSLTVNPVLLPIGAITVTATETARAITEEPA